MHLLPSTNRLNPDFLFSLVTGTVRSYCAPTTSTSTAGHWPSQRRGHRQNQPVATKSTPFLLLSRESKFLNLETIRTEPQRGKRKRDAHADLGEGGGVVALARHQAQKMPRTVALPRVVDTRDRRGGRAWSRCVHSTYPYMACNAHSTHRRAPWRARSGRPLPTAPPSRLRSARARGRY